MGQYHHPVCIEAEEGLNPAGQFLDIGDQCPIGFDVQASTQQRADQNLARFINAAPARGPEGEQG